MPVCAGEAAEGRDETGEDADEDDVGAEGTDHVNETEESHPELEESWKRHNKVSVASGVTLRGEWLTETGIKARVVYSLGEGSGSVVCGQHSEAECEPESAKGTEDNEGECVADDPLGWVSL